MNRPLPQSTPFALLLLATLLHGCASPPPAYPPPARYPVVPGGAPVARPVTVDPPDSRPSSPPRPASGREAPIVRSGETGIIREQAIPPLPSEPAPAPPEPVADHSHLVEQRLAVVTDKYRLWQQLHTTGTWNRLDSGKAGEASVCMERLTGIQREYAALRARIADTGSAPAQQVSEVLLSDISYLESDCGRLLDTLSGDAQQTVTTAEREEVAGRIRSLVEQRQYDQAISAYDDLKASGGEIPLEAKRFYGEALLRSGRYDEAIAVYREVTEAQPPTGAPWLLQRQLADMLVARGLLEEARDHYTTMLRAADEILPQRAYAQGRLTALQGGFDAASGALPAQQSPGARPAETPAPATEFLPIEEMSDDELRAQAGTRLTEANRLAEQGRHAEAMKILEELSRSPLPADMEQTVRQAMADSQAAAGGNFSTVSGGSAEELAEQWEEANRQLDQQQYDEAIASYRSLLNTDYDGAAREQLAKAAQGAAAERRKKAANLFVQAQNTGAPDRKKELLLASRRELQEILTKYPEAGLEDKVRGNMALIDKQIENDFPGLLQTLPR